MGKVYDDAIDVFTTAAMFDQTHGPLILELIPVIINSICALEPGTEFDYIRYLSDQMLNEEDVATVYVRTITYLSGPFGPLDMRFETGDGRAVTLSSSQLTKETICVSNDGEIHEHKNVFIRFKRNSRV